MERYFGVCGCADEIHGASEAVPVALHVHAAAASCDSCADLDVNGSCAGDIADEASVGKALLAVEGKRGSGRDVHASDAIRITGGVSCDQIVASARRVDR